MEKDNKRVLKHLKDYEEERQRLRDPKYKAAKELEKENGIKERWMKLKPFKDIYDIPPIPNDGDINWFVNRIVELGGIPLNELEEGEWYIGDTRNAKIAQFGKWREYDAGDFYEFRYVKAEWNLYVWEYCHHFQNADRFAVFVPLRKATKEEVDSEINKLNRI